MKPKSVHPIRQLFDRLMRIFEVVDVELAVSDQISVPVVACEDLTWIVVPSALADWPEPQAIAALARPFARIALGLPWFGRDASRGDARRGVAVARQVAPAFGVVPRERVEPLVADYELRARRAVDRKRKKSLEDIESALAHAPPMSVESFADAVVCTEARAAFLLSGRSAVGAQRPRDDRAGPSRGAPQPGARGALRRAHERNGA